MSGEFLEGILPEIKRIARECGEIIMKHYNAHDFTEMTKSSAADIVTQADLDSDKHLRTELSKHFPDAGMISEEDDDIPPKIRGPDEIWFCADPLDGTTNFSCGVPYFSVSIGVLDASHRSIAGCIFDPNRNEMFWAIKGKGAYLESNNEVKQIHVRRREKLVDCLIATGFSSDHLWNPDNNITEISHILPKVRDIRRWGGTCLDMCYVAASRFDGYWECGPHIWDVAASWIIAEEAGAVVSHYDSKPFTKESLRRPALDILCAPSELHAKLSEMIMEARKNIKST